MQEAARATAIARKEPRKPLARVIPMREPQAITEFTNRLKMMSNYEVWKNVESAIRAPQTSQGKAETENWRFRLLLDELQWRHSGLEGVDIDQTIVESQEVH